MSTRGTVIFLEKELENMDELSPDNFKNCPTIYIHSDMYPEGALPRIMEFLNIEGAKHRAFDSSYISAWFIGFIVNKQSRYQYISKDEKPEDTGFRYIKEIRQSVTKGENRLKKLIKEKRKQNRRIFSYEVFDALNIDTNKFIKDMNDFTGIGLQAGLNDWCDYTYIIIPVGKDMFDNESNFFVYVYDYKYKLIDVVNANEYIEINEI